MKTFKWLSLPTLLLVTLLLAGCSGQPEERPKADDKAANTDGAPGKGAEAEALANVKKLSPEDRKLAEEQRFCAVETGNPLGSMGVPVKVIVKGQPVFLCCDGCETKAKAHADRTLARVQQLKEKQAGTPQK